MPYGDSTNTAVTHAYDNTYIQPFTDPGYPNYYPNTYPPQQIYVYPQPYYVQQVDYGTQARLVAVEERLAEMQKTLERLMDLLGKGQDEKVCGHSEGGSDCADSGGGPGQALEVSGKPRPKGATTWPPQS